MLISSLQQGYVFAGRYQVLRCIAAGGMGAVYEVLHLETQRRRALKVMLPEIVHDRELRERFQREARVTSNVNSEFIVEVFDAGVDAGTGMPFLVMELLEGEELGARSERVGALPPAEVLVLLRQVATALDKTHAAGIVHRDLKPANLFLTQRDDGSPRIKILDFGISKVVTEGASNAAPTRSLGTPLYMAPEQLTSQPVGPETDTYALALIAFTLLVGAPYFQDEADQASSMIAFAMRILPGPEESALARAARRGVALPAKFDAWFRRATARSPGERFRRASELVTALGELFGSLEEPWRAPLVDSGASPPRIEPTAVPAASVPLEPWSKSFATRRSSRAPLGIALGVAAAVSVAAAVYVVTRGDSTNVGASSATGNATASTPIQTLPAVTSTLPSAPPQPEAIVVPSAVPRKGEALDVELPRASVPGSSKRKRAPREPNGVAASETPLRLPKPPEPSAPTLPVPNPTVMETETARPKYTRD